MSSSTGTDCDARELADYHNAPDSQLKAIAQEYGPPLYVHDESS